MRLRDLEGIRRLYALPSHGSAMHEFLLPALAQAKNYDRAAGYFNSRVLQEAATGISGLIRNGGKMRLITSHKLTEADTGHANRTLTDSAWASEVLEEFQSTLAGPTFDLESKIYRDYVKAMCWMLREEMLQIRIVLPQQENERENKLFHPKFGVITDKFGDQLAFSGSTNETFSGWLRNMENISTYPLWLQGFEPFKEFVDVFDALWEGEGIHEAGWETVTIPEAVVRELVEFADDDAVDRILEYEAKVAMTHSLTSRQPRKYQADALKAWEDSKRVGLLEMATGTGKTYTARLCMESARADGSLLTVLITPYQHISDQWALELADTSFEVKQLGKDGSWFKDLGKLLEESGYDTYSESGLVLIAVVNTAAKDEFLSMTSQISRYYDNFLLIGDEVHWLGAATFMSAMNPKANFRLGLSATPDRYYDVDGTDALRTYFKTEEGKPTYEFGLKEALEWGVLCPYEFHPIFVSLTEEEEDKWRAASADIARLYGKKDRTQPEQEQLEALQNQRAEVAKVAANKIPAFAELVAKLGPGLSQTIVYCANNAQLGEAVRVMRSSGLKLDDVKKITGEEDAGSRKNELLSERQQIIRSFSGDETPVIFAIRALDEGVDIPSAQTGIILASSGNPKEFIQRRGRLMRQHPGKEFSVIYDVIVVPPEEGLESLRRKELQRAREFAELAQNSDQALAEITSRLGRMIDGE